VTGQNEEKAIETSGAFKTPQDSGKTECSRHASRILRVVISYLTVKNSQPTAGFLEKIYGPMSQHRVCKLNNSNL